MNASPEGTSGLVLVDKPKGVSSFHVIRQLRKRLGVTKAGHAGTLDPFATGLLVCALGRATKALTFLQGGGKIYTGTVALGVRSTTDDITGECVLSAVPQSLTLEDVRVVAQRFVGHIQQIPPAVSALHVDGERAYDLVRRGEQVTLAARKVHVASFEVADLILLEDGTARFSFEVRCSKGTYIRALARDIGAILEVGGALATLRRTFSAPFDISAAASLESISPESVLPWYAGFAGAQPAETTVRERERLSHGCQPTLQGIIARLRSGGAGTPEEGYLLRVPGGGEPFGLLREVEGEGTLALSFL